MSDIQIAKMIYHTTMSIMKHTLDLEEMSYRENGRNDPRYKTFKKHVMSTTYDALRNLFEDMQDAGLIQYTDYEEDLKNGYVDSDSGGSGFVNDKKFDEFLSKLKND